MNFERLFFEILANLQRYLDVRPINLGGSSGENGGYEGRPGGFLGQLPQIRIAYDETEAATSGFIDSENPSLLDNLNHIRYDITNLQANSFESYNIDLSSQINGITNQFTINEPFVSSTLRIFYNGLRQGNFTAITSGFQLDFIPTSGDSLLVDYTRVV